MIKLLIFLGLSLNPGDAFAKKYWVKFGKDEKRLERQQEGFISPHCENCYAHKAITRKVKIDPSKFINKNPGAVKCKQLKGKVRIGKLYSGHSQSFCFFSDKSFVSTNLL